MTNTHTSKAMNINREVKNIDIRGNMDTNQIINQTKRFISTDQNTPIYQAGQFMYTFNLYPGDYRPSGTPNISHYNNITLIYNGSDTEESTKIEKYIDIKSNHIKDNIDRDIDRSTSRSTSRSTDNTKGSDIGSAIDNTNDYPVIYI